MTETVASLIADHPADALALGAPGRPWLTYGGLRDQSAATAAALHGLGVGRGEGPTKSGSGFGQPDQTVSAPKLP